MFILVIPQKSAASKSKSKSKSSAKDATFSWPSQIPDILGVMVKALRTIKTERIWVTTAERDEVVACVSLSLAVSKEERLMRVMRV